MFLPRAIVPGRRYLIEKVFHQPGIESLTAIRECLPLVASKPSRFFDPNHCDLPGLVQPSFCRAGR